MSYLIFKICLILLLVHSAYQIDLEQELCVDGSIDAGFSISDRIILFKSKTIYIYQFETKQQENRQMLINSKTNLTIYNDLIKHFEPDTVLKFRMSKLFSDLCPVDLEFKHIKSALYDSHQNDTKTVYLTIEGEKAKLIRMEVNFKSENMNFNCSTLSFTSFIGEQNFSSTFEHVVYLPPKNSQKRYFEIEDSQFHIFYHVSPVNRLGPFPLILLHPKFPAKADAVIAIRNKIWIFKRNSLYIIDLKLFDNVWDTFEELSKNLSFISVESSNKYLKINTASLMDIILSNLNSNITTAELPLRVIEPPDYFYLLQCPSFQLAYVLGITNIFIYMYYHPYLLSFLLILLLIVCPICCWIAYMLVKQRERERVFQPSNRENKSDQQSDNESESSKRSNSLSECLRVDKMLRSKFKRLPAESLPKLNDPNGSGELRSVQILSQRPRSSSQSTSTPIYVKRTVE